MGVSFVSVLIVNSACKFTSFPTIGKNWQVKSEKRKANGVTLSYWPGRDHSFPNGILSFHFATDTHKLRIFAPQTKRTAP